MQPPLTQLPLKRPWQHRLRRNRTPNSSIVLLARGKSWKSDVPPAPPPLMIPAICVMARCTASARTVKPTSLYPSFSILSWCRLHSVAMQITGQSCLPPMVASRLCTRVLAQNALANRVVRGTMIKLVGPARTKLLSRVNPSARPSMPPRRCKSMSIGCCGC